MSQQHEKKSFGFGDFLKVFGMLCFVLALIAGVVVAANPEMRNSIRDSIDSPNG